MCAYCEYTNRGKSDEKRSPPKTTIGPSTRWLWWCQSSTCSRTTYATTRSALEDGSATKEESEATEAPRRGSAKATVEESKVGEVQPAGRKRRGRPKRSERPAAARDEPQAGPQDEPDAVVDARAPPEAEGQPPALRRGRSRDSGPRGQRDRGRSC